VTDDTDASERAADVKRQADVLADVASDLHGHVGALSTILRRMRSELPEENLPSNFEDIENDLRRLRTSLDEISPSSPAI
jgi:hypothetical protein